MRVAIVACSALALSAAVASAKPCKTYQGTFTAVRPAQCLSAVGICTHGTLVGGFPSTYDFTVDTIAPGGDPSAPNKFAYTGHSVITDPHGAQMFGRDSGFLVMNGDGTASFVTTIDVVDGTRKYSHVSARFVAPGVLNLATGSTRGTYSATICHGSGRPD